MTLIVAPPTPIRVSPSPAYVPPPSTINSVASNAQARQAQVAGRGATNRVVFGQDRIGAYIAADPIVYNGKWILLCQWCVGEIEAVLDIQVNGIDPPVGSVFTTYLGTPGQTVDPMLVAAFAAQTPKVIFADAMPGIAWSLAQIPFNSTSGFPVITALVKGLKLYDERTDLTVWSETPGLALAAYLSSPVWGEGKTVAGAGEVATANEVIIGAGALQEQHRKIGLVLDRRQPTASWRETLRLYAGCLIIPDGDGYRLVPDEPADVAISFDVGGENNNIISLGEINIAGKTQLPTAVRVQYTDPVTWQDAWTKYITRPGVDTGETEWRPLDLQLPGIQRNSQGEREAAEYLNKLWLGDVSTDIFSTDIGLRSLPGSVVGIIDPRGLVAQMRILSVSGERGRLKLPSVKYDPAMYCLTVVANPTTPDTNWPEPTDPPTPTGLVVTERNFTMGNGSVATRFEASWQAVDFPFPFTYRCSLKAGGVIVDTKTTEATSYASNQVQEGAAYQLTVAVTSTSVAKTGTPVTWGGIALGKRVPPADVTGLRVYEMAGEAFIDHDPVVDSDWTSTEYRFTAYNDAHDANWHWANGVLIDFNAKPSVSATTKKIPVGTWMVTAKGHDSVNTDTFPLGQESINAAGQIVNVTLNPYVRKIDDYTFTVGNLTNMKHLNWPLPQDDMWISTNSATWNSTLTAGMDTYGDPLPTYFEPASSELKTEIYDLGLIVPGEAIVTEHVRDLAGAHDTYIGWSDTGVDGTFTEYLGTSCRASGRFVYIRHVTTGSMAVDALPSINIHAVTKPEYHDVTTSDSGPTPVTLDGRYIRILDVNVQPKGNSAIVGTYDDDAVVVGLDADNIIPVYAFAPPSWAQIGASVRVTVNAI